MSDRPIPLPNAFDDIAALEKDLGVPSGFFQRLVREGDDWSFVIKMHALVEGAVAHLLVHVLGDDRLGDVFAHLELSDPRTGKVAFAAALDCLDSDERRTIRKLSELRNHLVHNVTNVDFTFEAWASELDPNQLDSVVKAFGPRGETIEIAKVHVPAKQFFRENARSVIWLSCLLLLSLIYGRKDLAGQRREAAAEWLKFTEESVERYGQLLSVLEKVVPRAD